MKKEKVPTAIPNKNLGRLLPVARLSTIALFLTVLFLVYALISGLTLQFYASFLFLFYSISQSMWISVVMLGIFQTLMLIPFRIVNLLKSAHIQDFQKNIEKLELEKEQQYIFRKQFSKGQRVVLFYIVNFFVQIVLFISLGRLFLIDFYTKKLDPDLLYSFVKYPEYPLQDKIFKIPYVWFHDTTDFGMRVVLWGWGVIIAIQVGIYVFKYFQRKFKRVQAKITQEGIPQERVLKVINKYSTGYLVVALILAYVIVRHFPVNWKFYIFSGDLSVPSRTLNTITAMATAFTLIWINLPKINKKVQLAKQAGVDSKVISRTEKELFRESVVFAGIVGLGAFYITNLIPSAFELSVFTLEIISWTGPFTLDKVIFKAVGTKKTMTKDRVEKKETEKKTEEKRKMIPPREKL